MLSPEITVKPVRAQSIASWLATLLQRSWLARGWLAIALYDVSLLYRALVALRSWLYARGIFKSTRLNVPVIIVGNVVAGGAGKTPVVIELVRFLQAQGCQVGVVSRGYGRRTGRSTANDNEAYESDSLQVSSNTPVALSGDEPALIHAATQAPVWVGHRRAGAAQALLAAHPDTKVIVCDDGLQHLALQRDIEICVFDERGLGNGWLLPAGPLRERWPRKKPANFVLHTAALPPRASHLSATSCYRISRRLAPHALRADGSQVPLATLLDQPIHAVAAIAQPEAFFSMLRSQGLTLAETTALPDHYDFNSWMCNISLGYTLICTQKDASKLWLKHPEALAVPLVVDIPPAFFQAFTDQLSALVSSPHGHQTT
jgi:tetraacyldisaccharide 4'-kinase